MAHHLNFRHDGSMFVTSGSARLACDVVGDGPAVLLLHAGVTDSRSWAPLIEHLGGRWRTVAYDRQGFGRSTWEAEPHIEMDDALAVLDAAGVDAAIVIGASNGGRRALDLALAHPERVRGLVLIGAGVSGAPELDLALLPTEVQALIATYEAAEDGDDLDLVNRIEAHAWLDGWTAPEGRVTGTVRDLFLAMNAIALHAPPVGDEQPPAPAWDRLGEIQVPTLVLCGEHDIIAVPAAQHLANQIAGARYEVIEAAGHLPHLEGDARTLDLIAEHLASIG